MSRLAVLGVMASMLLAGGCHSPRVETTTGKQKDAIARFLSLHIKTVTREGETVRFVTDRFFGVMEEGTWKTTFVLKVGGKFSQMADHHGWTSLKVVEVGREGVTLKYETGFNHLSFGKNLVTIDKGEVTVAFKSE